jgi:hypothetical protein
MLDVIKLSSNWKKCFCALWDGKYDKVKVGDRYKGEA